MIFLHEDHTNHQIFFQTIKAYKMAIEYLVVQDKDCKNKNIPEADKTKNADKVFEEYVTELKNEINTPPDRFNLEVKAKLTELLSNYEDCTNDILDSGDGSLQEFYSCFYSRYSKNHNNDNDVLNQLSLEDKKVLLGTPLSILFAL